MSDAENHLAQSQASLAAVKRMEAGLAAGEEDMRPYFTQGFTWRGNRGCGTKPGLDAFKCNWQRPFRLAFTNRDYRTEKFIADGDWSACFGHIEADHTGTFMSIAPTGRRIRIPYMDFWRIEDGRIADNPVSVDFAEVLHQLGRDIFDGEGWEAYDDGSKIPAKPDNVED